jgi:uncharacterized protein (DUF4213/DUF364 family)
MKNKDRGMAEMWVEDVGLGLGWSPVLLQGNSKQVASLMDSLPQFISLAGFDFHRFMADGTERETRA